VLWFEHDLYDQLLLIRHLWRLSMHPPSPTRYAIVIGTDYLGLLQPNQFPAKFAARRVITAEEIVLGTEIWAAYCGNDPGRLAAFADVLPDGESALRQSGTYLPQSLSGVPESGSPSDRVRRLLPYVPRAMRRLVEEFPAVGTGLARSERQILEVLSEGPRSPEQAFVAAARLEEDIWMGDWPFWSIVKRLAQGAHPLIGLEVQDVPGRLPSGTLSITDAGRRVLAGDADHLALNAPSRWIGGTLLSPERPWRWTGFSLLPPTP